jgi:hypothetical protein
MKVYCIKRLEDGLYSTGGIRPGFTGKGKIWSSMAALKSHLTTVKNNITVHRPWPYMDCCIMVLSDSGGEPCGLLNEYEKTIIKEKMNGCLIK